MIKGVVQAVPLIHAVSRLRWPTRKQATDITLADELPHINPYAAPATVSDASVSAMAPVRIPWLQRFIALQSIVIVIALAVEAYEHESIVVSGAIFTLIGLAIAIEAYRHRDRSAMAFGGSAIAFASLVVFLINYNSWGPAQGNRPITLLSFMYAAFALPMSAWLVLARSRTAAEHPLSVDR